MAKGTSKQGGSTKWQKGQSGNPGGRPKEVHEVKELAREHTEDAIRRLVFWMQTDNPKASVSAAQALLDRAWGKAPQAITGDNGGAVEAIIQIVSGVPRAE